ETNATVVPSSAVMAGQQGTYVFTVEADGSAKQHLVRVARAMDTMTVIASGIEPGMTVVTDGQLRLTPGAKVEVKNQPPATTRLDAMTSSSGMGGTSITLQFSLSRNIDNAAQDVQANIAKVVRSLPRDMLPPSYQKVNPADQPIMYMALSSATLPLSTLDEYAE